MEKTAMARPGVTYDQVQAAADELVADNKKPTIDAVRAQLGTGSPNTIHRHLTQWREAQTPAERPAPKLSDGLLQYMADEVQRATAAARAEAEQRANDAQAAADRLSKTGETLEQERDDAQAAQVTAESERDKAAAERDAKQQEIDRLHNDLENERQTSESKRTELAQALNKVENLEKQTGELREQIQLEKQSREAAEQRATDAEKHAATLAERVESRDEMIMSLRTERDNATNDSEQLRTALDTERDARSKAEANAKAAQERANASDKAASDAQDRANNAETRLHEIYRQMQSNTRKTQSKPKQSFKNGSAKSE